MIACTNESASLPCQSRDFLKSKLAVSGPRVEFGLLWNVCCTPLTCRSARTLRHPKSPCRTRSPSWTKQGRQAQKESVWVGETHNPRSLLRSCRPYIAIHVHIQALMCGDSVCRGCTDNAGYIQAKSCCLLRLLGHWWLVFYHLPTWISDCILEALHTFERRKFLRGTSFAMKASLEWSTLSSVHWILGNARWGPCPHPRENMRSFTHCGFANIVPSIRSQPVLLAGPLVDRLLRQTPSLVHGLKYISVRPGSLCTCPLSV